MGKIEPKWPGVALVLGLAAIVGAVATWGPPEVRAPIASLLVVLAGAIRTYVSAADVTTVSRSEDR